MRATRRVGQRAGRVGGEDGRARTAVIRRRPRLLTGLLAITLAGAILAGTALTASAQAVPDPPTITDTDPDSPSSDQNPSVKGTVGGGSPTVLVIYTTANCNGQPAASGSVAAFTGAGIGVPVAFDTTTQLAARAIDGGGFTSDCSAPFPYVHDDGVAPDPPTITDTDPDSPANDPNPRVKGSVDEVNVTEIMIFAVEGPVRCGVLTDPTTGTVAEFEGQGIAVAVSENATTNLVAKAKDHVGKISGCFVPLAYVHDSTIPPEAPTITGTDPGGPANENDPLVKGTVGSGSPAGVFVYSSSDCSGGASSGTVADFTGQGIGVSVPDDATTSLSARAPNAYGFLSPCSAPFDYTEDSTPPQTSIVAGPPDPATAKPTFGFSASEAGSTFTCRIDATAFGPCSGAGDTHTPSSSLSPGAHSFEVRATDPAGNSDPTPAAQAFTVAGTDAEASGAASAKRTQKQKGSRVRVKVKVAAAEALQASATGKIKLRGAGSSAAASRSSFELKGADRQLAEGEKSKLKLRPKRRKDERKIVAALSAGRKAKAKLKVTLADRAGNELARRLVVKLKPRR